MLVSHSVNVIYESPPIKYLLFVKCFATIWEQFDSVGSDEVDRALDTVNATACQLDPCLF